jgi:hypothetical protein
VHGANRDVAARGLDVCVENFEWYSSLLRSGALQPTAPKIAAWGATGKQEVGSMTDRTRVTIRTIDLGSVIRELRTKSQAGTVLVSAAVVEDRLQQLLLTKMRTLSNNKAKRIFNGPLRSLAAKIDVAYAFELIEDELYDDLTIIRDIRNEFAHSVTERNFESPEVVELVQKFTGRDASVDAFSFFQQRIESCSNQIEAKLQRALFDYAVKVD